MFAPSKSIFFVTKDADGKADGVTSDLSKAYAASLGIPVEEVLYPNSGAAADALEAGDVDVTFMPVDASRQARFEVGPAYTFVESTFMVTGETGITKVEEVDREGIRIAAVADTSTLRLAQASLKKASIVPVATVAEAVQLMKDGKADGFALSRDSLPAYVAQIPGSRIVEGAFQRSGVAIMVQKGNKDALEAATDFITTARTDGTIRKALDHAGYTDQAVADQ